MDSPDELLTSIFANEELGKIRSKSDINEQFITYLVDKCKSLDPKSVSFNNDVKFSAFISGFVGCLKACYAYSSDHAAEFTDGYEACKELDTMPSNEKPSGFLSSLFATQCWFFSVIKLNFSKAELLKPSLFGLACKELMSLAQVADNLGESLSLPIWKFGSSIMKQFKCEIRNYARETSRNGDKSFENDPKSFFGSILNSIVYSLRHYYNKCRIAYLGGVKSNEMNVKNTENNIQMLNLLSRIFTFCIREFTKEILTTDINSQAVVTFMDWLSWTVNVSYAGGLYPLGSKFPVKIGEEINNSFFLSIDIILSHMITLHPPYEGQEDCSVFIQAISHSDFDAPVICRIYGKILSNISQHPSFYPRWMNDTFNIYKELFEACEKIDLSGKNDGTNDEKYPCSAEFYTTLLQQICASVCGLSMVCFPYLETALLSSVLSEHPLVHLLAMDVWCFVARYGTGDLCLHYVTLLTNIVNKVARKLQMKNCMNESQSLSLSHTVSRFSHLLSRLIVFLTPKQQSVYLHQNSIKFIYMNSNTDLISSTSGSLIWYYVPIPINRLQKVSTSIIEQQVNERILNLDKLFDLTNMTVNSSQITYLLIEVCLALRLFSCLSDPHKNSCKRIIVKCIHFLLQYHLTDAVIENCSHPHSSTFLKFWTLQPISAVLVCLSIWFPKLCSISLNDPNLRPDTEILKDLVRLSFYSDSTSPVLPICSFSIYNTWNSWLNCSITQGYLQTWFEQLRVNINHFESKVQGDPIGEDVFKSMRKRIDSISLTKHTVHSPQLGEIPSGSCFNIDNNNSINNDGNGDVVITKCLRDMSLVVNRLKSVWPPKGPNKSVQFNEARNILNNLSNFVYTS
ncbi:histidyl-tRNA synthetase-related [Schistosoma mansoni]|uniref:Histidyl-tRNA synthetase-related n=1 Tax=Schistosoma mansoni TaxID=6183 RepID=A0A3Q0KP66_SCHMA|nr:histidyl-tRNA synthetase-related [Schistosoma mansoni]|eukprot:XP_018649967.1 histidyl-tRNA synthetase-related [Schistosoma mansoni]